MTVTGTVAVRVTLPIVTETLIVDVPERIPRTVPPPSTSATVAVVDVKLGAGKFAITAPAASNAETVIDCEFPAARFKLVTFVLMEPSV